jgi:condensin-2 complex subunit G2
MGNLIHDKTEKVRLATVNLLLKVKDTKGIRFYHVVPVSHLTARLAEEYRINQNPTTPVAKELTKLMLNSYFPQGSKVKGADQLKRTLTFFMTDPSAAIVFYANLVDLLEEEAVIKFIVMLLACLKSAVDTDQASKVRNSKTQKKRRRQQHQEEQKSQQQNLSASNTALMAALAETIAILVEALIPILEDDHPCKVVLVDRFAELGVINILAHFEEIASDNTSQNNEEEVTKRNDSLRTYAAILRCLAQLPQDTVDGIVGFIASSLSCLNEEMRPLHFIMSHLAPLCVWGMTEDIASTLAKSMESAFHNEDSFLSPCSLMSLSMKSRQSNVAKKKNKSKVDLPTLSPDVAFGIVNHILKGSNLSSAFIRQELLQSQEAYSCLKQCLEMGIIYAERLFVTDTVRMCLVVLFIKRLPFLILLTLCL